MLHINVMWKFQVQYVCIFQLKLCFLDSVNLHSKWNHEIEMQNIRVALQKNT